MNGEGKRGRSFAGRRSRRTVVMPPDQTLMLMKTKRLANGEKKSNFTGQLWGEMEIDGRRGRKRKKEMSRADRFLFGTPFRGRRKKGRTARNRAERGKR